MREQEKANAELVTLRDGAMDRQKSAEGIVGPSSTGSKARTSRRERSFRFDGEGDADKEG
jgi:hypothetical protein